MCYGMARLFLSRCPSAPEVTSKSRSVDQRFNNSTANDATEDFSLFPVSEACPGKRPSWQRTPSWGSGRYSHRNLCCRLENMGGSVEVVGWFIWVVDGWLMDPTLESWEH